MASLQNANFVILPAQLNVAAIQQIWLLDNGILEREDFTGETVFTPVAVSVKSPRIELLILQDRIQLIAPDGPDAERTISSVVMGFVSSLPTAQFLAAGMNFTYWHDVENIAEVSRSLWLGRDNPWASQYQAADAQFGFYASKDALECRLKADVKPARKPDGANGIAFTFNYHKDLSAPPDGAEQIRTLVASWNRARELAQGLASAVVERTTANV